MNLSIKKRLFIFFFLIIGVTYAQNSKRIVIDTLFISKNEINLQYSKFIVDSIISIKLDTLLLSKTDYIFDRLNQKIHFINSSYDNIKTIVEYRIFSIQKLEFQKNKPVIKQDSSGNQKIVIHKNTYNQSITDPFLSPSLQRSGTIVRGFSIGTNRDFALNSGLRLQLSGNLSEDIEVTAVLSDQQSPIQPEGNTRTLQEVDNVYIEFKHKYARAVFGDYQFNQRVGSFGIIDKKLQGIEGNILFNSKNDLVLSYASAKGKFRVQQFLGIDGVQGPYRLTGENNERDIIVLAGTEKVYINGEEKIRGENYDYTIDYSTGEIFFTPRVVITSASRIKVEFEYSDRKFERNFFGLAAHTLMLNEKIEVGLSYFQEGDDPNSPLDLSISEEDKKILISSGNDRYLASKSGVRFVGYDTLGRPAGQYRLKDTIINSIKYTFYEYDPGGDSSFYQISFSFVGEGKGDYKKIGLGKYVFVGQGKGHYLPIIFLPMPELKRLSSFHTRINPIKKFFIKGDFSISLFDKNRFSQIDDEQNLGNAYKLKFGIDSTNLNLGSLDLGLMSFNYSERFIDKRFTPFANINEIEFERNWNINQERIANERFRNFTINIFKDYFTFRTNYGNLKKENYLESNKIETQIDFQLKEKTQSTYLFSNLKSRSEVTRTDWQRHFLSSTWNFNFFETQMKLEFERKLDKIFSYDSLLNSSFQFIESSLGLSSKHSKYFEILSSINFRIDELPIQNILSKESFSNIYTIGVKTKNVKNFYSNLFISYRNKKYYEEFKKLGRVNNNSLGIRYFSRGEFFEKFTNIDLYYEATSQRSARLEKIFIRVPKGSGNYIYKGDLNNNGVADEFEFEPTRFDGEYIVSFYPTDELFPVTDLKASFQLKLAPEKLKLKGILFDLIKPFSLLTLLRIEENSKDENLRNIYLIKWKTFQNPSTTIKGSNLIQFDLNLFENNTTFNLLFRFIERKNFNSFNITNERRFQQERFVRLRYKPIKEFANQSELLFVKNNLYSSNVASRNFLIDGVQMNTKLFYYPVKFIEASLKFEVGKSINHLTPLENVLNSNSIQFTFSYSYTEFGRINLEIERTEIILSRKDVYLPFELTRGYFAGKNYLWRIFADYRIASNLITNLSYEGRVQGKSNPIHLAQAEIRVYF